MSRETCFYCVSKHLAQAQVLCDEYRLGYPLHRWLAVGHLAEAVYFSGGFMTPEMKQNLLAKIANDPIVIEHNMISLELSCSLYEKVMFDDAMMAMNRALDKHIREKYGRFLNLGQE